MNLNLLEVENCTICLNELPDNHSILNCNHKFCTSCIEDLLNNNKYNCPLCRSRINEYKNNQNTVLIKYIKRTISINNRVYDNIFISVNILSIILFILLVHVYGVLTLTEDYNRLIKGCYIDCLYNKSCNLNISNKYLI